MTGQQIGILIGVVAGGGWAVAGSAALRGAWRPLATSASIGLAALLAIATVRFPPTATTGRFDGGIYGIAVAAETLSIIVAVAFLRRSGRQRRILPAIAMIVGLHFLGLWRATGDEIFLALTAGLCLVGLAGLRVSEPQQLPVIGFGCALVLWVSAGFTILASP